MAKKYKISSLPETKLRFWGPPNRSHAIMLPQLRPNPTLRSAHTCNVTAYRSAVTLPVTDTIRSYELNFHPVPHGVTVSCERYTLGFPVCYGSPSDVFATSSGFVYLYTLRFKEREIRADDGDKGNCTQAGKCTAVRVCWQTGIFSRSAGYIGISPECLPMNLNF